MRWADEILHEIDRAESEQALFDKVRRAAEQLGFEYCAYGMRLPVPVTSPKTLMVNNYPSIWQQRYAENRYLETDPTVQRGCLSQAAMPWSDELFAGTPALWDDARDAGLRIGWAKSTLEASSVGGMLTLARSTGILTEKELAAKEPQMRWLAQTAHQGFRRVQAAQWNIALSVREKEVLRWAADGKTANEISTILAISVATVKFHTKNAAEKLGTFNRTAAVVRAVAMGLLF